MNRLAGVTSPYLLQHAENPVDWWPWSPEAFEEARRRDVPILLSVGYASCHWCHVMAHESFEDDDTAAYLNEHFVSVKVDREERPDVDAVYMEAVQAATGQGGWPMTVFLTPDAEPFYFGTYFPPEPRHGSPSFRQVLEGVSAAWTGRREEVAEVAGRIVADLAGRSLAHGGDGVPGESEVAQALLGLTREYDEQYGGSGRAQVPAVHGRGVPAAALLPYGGRGCPSDGCRHLFRDGPGRDLRPARRRVRAVLRGPGVGGPALREDAVRQRAALPGVRPSLADHRVRGGPPYRPGDRRLHGAGAAYRRGRFRLRARCRQRGSGRKARRGCFLCVDPRATACGAR